MRSRRSGMRCYHLAFHLTVIFCSFLIISTSSLPIEENRKVASLEDDLEVLDKELSSSSRETESDPLLRTKRTIGFLRQLFPGLSQMIDRKIQQLTRIIFRIVGRLILRGGGPGGGGAGTKAGGEGESGSGGGGGRISITLPTYPPFDEDEEEDGAPTTFGQSGDNETSSTSSSALTLSEQTTRSQLPDFDSNQIAENIERLGRRVHRDVSDVLSDVASPALEDETNSEDFEEKKSLNAFLSRMREIRKKRNLLRFGNQNSGGSGNVIFDIIRLVAGSGTTPEKDEELNAPRDERDDFEAITSSNSTYNTDNNVAGSTEDTYDAAIPGPLTRLFIIVNRGISNMIQDLILRLAQTSERIINFKARLITSII